MESTCGTFWALKTFYTRSCKKYNTNFLKKSLFRKNIFFMMKDKNWGKVNLEEVAQGLLGGGDGPVSFNVKQGEMT